MPLILSKVSRTQTSLQLCATKLGGVNRMRVVLTYKAYEQAYFSLSSLVLGPDRANLKITLTLLLTKQNKKWRKLANRST